MKSKHILIIDTHVDTQLMSQGWRTTKFDDWLATETDSFISVARGDGRHLCAFAQLPNRSTSASISEKRKYIFIYTYFFSP